MKNNQLKELEYQIIRSNRKTTDIIIERDGSILVRAPQWTDDEQIKNIIKSKQYWIHKNLAKWRDLNSNRIIREYKNGESFLYLGRTYRLQLVSEQKAPLLLKNGRFMIRRDLVENGSVEKAQKALIDYFIERGKVKITKRVNYYAPKIDVQPTGVDIRELGYRWATCSPAGKLSFHWKCMMAPPKIIDYIIVHELCHFHCSEHNDMFWNEVDKVMPDYYERKEWLRKNGAGLDI